MISGDPLRASYGYCRRKSRQSGSSFYASFLVLPGAKRRAMDALYAFMRHTDDLADNPQPAHLRSRALVEWRAALDHALLGCERPGAATQLDQAGWAILPALADTVRRFHVPPEHLRAVIDGVAMDVGRQYYQTFADLEKYCQLVASAVGLACIHVWGFRGQGSPEGLGAFEPARKCGVALQLTNVLRDLREDVEADRVYLPLEDLQACNYSLDELMLLTANERFDRLVALEVERAKEFYRQGAPLAGWLNSDGRRVLGMIMATYRALLRRIERRPRDLLTRRVSLGNREKLQIAARWILLPTS